MGSVCAFDDWALAPYVREIAHQRDAALIAIDQFNAAVAADGNLVQRVLAAQTVSADERLLVNRNLFAAAQGILTAGAMISKFLWTGDHDSAELHCWAKARAAGLRRVLKIKGQSPLESRAARNALEHFDERLDRILMDGLPVVDYNVGPPGMVLVDGHQPLELRRLDLAAGTITVLGAEADQAAVDYQELVRCIVAVGDEADRWLDSHAS